MRLTDAQLLTRFADSHEETAFAALVQRHGPMVLGVCRRLLQHQQEAEDAFQATFLVLARRAGQIREREAVASWLYGVASRLAAKLRCQASQRREKEKQYQRLPAPQPGADLLSFVIWQELRPVLDEELGRLPEKYRSPLVLCYLEGKSHDEAAAELGWPKGSMSRRMDKARDLLRNRLVRRGITLPAGVVFALLAQHQCSLAEPLAQHTMSAALAFVAPSATVTGSLSPSVATLAQGALHTMSSWSIGKLTAGSFLLLALLGGTTGMLALSAHGQSPSTSPSATALLALVQVPDSKPSPVQATSTRAVPKPPGAAAVAPPGAQGSQGAAAKPDGGSRGRFLTHREVHQLLDKPTDFFERGFMNGENFNDVLKRISTEFHVTIRYNRAAMRQKGLTDMESIDNAEIRLPGATNVTLRQVLKELTTQLNAEAPLTFVVKGNQIFIEPQVNEGELSTDDPKSPALPLRELVSLSVEKVPLREALRELADATGANIVLDVRLQEQGDTLVTASLQHVPLMTAVTLLTDMAELQAVPLDNVLYVTNQENALRLTQNRYGVRPMPGRGGRAPQAGADPRGGRTPPGANPIVFGTLIAHDVSLFSRSARLLK